jgi:hypothetical protein
MINNQKPIDMAHTQIYIHYMHRSISHWLRVNVVNFSHVYNQSTDFISGALNLTPGTPLCLIPGIGPAWERSRFAIINTCQLQMHLVDQPQINSQFHQLCEAGEPGSPLISNHSKYICRANDDSKGSVDPLFVWFTRCHSISI